MPLAFARELSKHSLLGKPGSAPGCTRGQQSRGELSPSYAWGHKQVPGLPCAGQVLLALCPVWEGMALENGPMPYRDWEVVETSAWVFVLALHTTFELPSVWFSQNLWLQMAVLLEPKPPQNFILLRNTLPPLD